MPAFEVDESIQIDASVASVKNALLDFRGWHAWSPWICADPGCTVDYAEDGQSYRWDGAIIGSGSMKLVKEEPDAIFYDLAFLKPFKSQSKVDFKLIALGPEKTQLHWRMQSSMPFFLFFLVKSTRAMIRNDYRRGLAKIKDKLELGSVPSILEFLGVGKGVCSAYLGIRKVCTIEELAAVSKQLFTRLSHELDTRVISPSGAPMTISHSFDLLTDQVALTMAVPVPDVLQDLGSEFVSERLDIPRSYQVIHKGAYRHLSNAWASGMMHQRAKRFLPHKGLDKVEVYLNDPASTQESELLTELHFPAR